MKSTSAVRPTDALANERTFLAYIRTALSFVAFGFVIARFSLFAHELSMMAKIDVPTTQVSVAFGTAMAIAGILVGGYGSYRYVVANAALAREETLPMSPWAAIVGGAVVASIGIIVAVDLFALSRAH
jgi:putative membrane protein